MLGDVDGSVVIALVVIEGEPFFAIFDEPQDVADTFGVNSVSVFILA